MVIHFQQALRTDLNAGKDLGMPDGVLINGKGPYQYNTTLVPIVIEYESIQVEPGIWFFSLMNLMCFYVILMSHMCLSASCYITQYT